MGLFDKLKQGLQKTKQLLQTDIRDVFKPGELLNEEVLEQFEARLILTDMGVSAADAIVTELREKHLGRTVVLDEIWGTIKEQLRTLLRGDDGIEWDVNNPLSPFESGFDRAHSDSCGRGQRGGENDFDFQTGQADSEFRKESCACCRGHIPGSGRRTVNDVGRSVGV